MEEQIQSPLQLAEALRKVREKLGLSQEQWAARLGVSVRTVSRWEIGTSDPRGALQKATIAMAAPEEERSKLRRLLGLRAETESAAAATAGAAMISVFSSPLGLLGTSLLAAAKNGLTTAKTPTLETPEMLLRYAASGLGVEWTLFRAVLLETLKSLADDGQDLPKVIALLETKP